MDWTMWLEFAATLAVGIVIGWRLASSRVEPKDRTCQCGHKEWAHRIRRNDRGCTVIFDKEKNYTCACEWFVPRSDKELEKLRKIAELPSK